MLKARALQLIKAEIYKTFDRPEMQTAAAHFGISPQKLSNDLAGRPELIPAYLLDFAGFKLKSVDHNYIKVSVKV